MGNGMSDTFGKLMNGAFATGQRYLADKAVLEKCLAMFRK